jgi:phage gp37-like protein
MRTAATKVTGTAFIRTSICRLFTHLSFLVTTAIISAATISADTISADIISAAIITGTTTNLHHLRPLTNALSRQRLALASNRTVKPFASRKRGEFFQSLDDGIPAAPA